MDLTKPHYTFILENDNNHISQIANRKGTILAGTEIIGDKKLNTMELNDENIDKIKSHFQGKIAELQQKKAAEKEEAEEEKEEAEGKGAAGSGAAGSGAADSGAFIGPVTPERQLTIADSPEAGSGAFIGPVKPETLAIADSPSSEEQLVAIADSTENQEGGKKIRKTQKKRRTRRNKKNKRKTSKK